MTVDELPRSETFHDSPAVRLAKAHERRAAVRALAGLARNRTDFEVLADMLDLDPADGRADLPPLVLMPVLPPPPDEPEPVDLVPAGLRNLAPVSTPISPPRDAKPKVTAARRRTRAAAKNTQPHPKPEQKPTPADVAAVYDQAAEHVEQTASAEPTPRKWSNTTPAARRGRQPNPFDPAEAARRYLEGEPLFTLAGELHIGVNTLRRALLEQGVQIRKRGEVIGTRGPAPTPIDPDVVRRLYLDEGLNTVQIAGRLHVKSQRVQDLLRQLGILRPPGGRHPGAGAVNSVRLKLGPDLSAQVRLRASALGKPIGHYLRDLVLADLIADVTARDQAR